MYRNTCANIYLSNLNYNIKSIINKYNDYKYYIGVVKADSYGHNSEEVVKTIIESGCNYLAVSSLDEALIIRKDFDIPILCLGIINEKYIKICEENNIDVTVTNLKYLNKIKNNKVKVHIKVDTGMNRLGVKDQDEFYKMIKVIDKSNLKLQGIYTHIYDAKSKFKTLNQIKKFKRITNDVDLSKIPLIHISQSDTLLNYPKIDICNSCRLGLIMYGLSNDKLNLKSTISLHSEIIEIKKLKKGDTVSYNGVYKAKKNEIIGIVSIGYADGINRKLQGSFVYIKNKKYKIIGNICMDMLMIKIDNTVKLNDIVNIYKDNKHILEQSKYLKTIPYELICNISKRVPRIYIK